MELALTPAIEHEIEEQLARGFPSPEAVILSALNALSDSQTSLDLRKEELEARILEGIRAADLGETVSAEEARQRLATFRASL